MKSENTSETPATPVPLRHRLRAFLFRELFATEYLQRHNYRKLAEDFRQEVDRLNRELAQRDRGRSARFRLVGALADEVVARRLAGTVEAPLMQAVMAVIDAKIVEMSDRATNPPGPANPPELRTYEAGGANAVAELKARLQEATQPQDSKLSESAP